MIRVGHFKVVLYGAGLSLGNRELLDACPEVSFPDEGAVAGPSSRPPPPLLLGPVGRSISIRRRADSVSPASALAGRRTGG
jgi:hypothetical protein